MNITFSDSVITGYIVSGAAAILLTLIFVLVWKIKTKAALIPMLVGAATFMIFARDSKRSLRFRSLAETMLFRRKSSARRGSIIWLPDCLQASLRRPADWSHSGSC